jgi:competence protein ComEA
MFYIEDRIKLKERKRRLVPMPGDRGGFCFRRKSGGWNMGMIGLRYRKWLLLILAAGTAAGGFAAYSASRNRGDASVADVNGQMKMLLEARAATAAPSGAITAGSSKPADTASRAADPSDPAEEPPIAAETVEPPRSKADTFVKPGKSQAKASPAPGKSQVKTSPAPAAKPAPKGSLKINLNTASLESLLGLPGIGESKANAIVAYREQNGGFKTVDELLNVKGIGPKLLDNIRNKVTV